MEERRVFWGNDDLYDKPTMQTTIREPIRQIMTSRPLNPTGNLFQSLQGVTGSKSRCPAGASEIATLSGESSLTQPATRLIYMYIRLQKLGIGQVYRKNIHPH
jgi:hypothetical protein